VSILLDTSVLGRLANAADAANRIASTATLELHQRGELLHLTAQNMIEFRNMATRPVALNGLGLSVAEAEAKAAAFESKFSLLSETPDIFPAWKAIVSTLGVIGKQVHDARLVAVCHAHNITHLLTFNVAHFKRLTAFGPAVTALDPATV
jgi:predicted nucleic acid-binding protein